MARLRRPSTSQPTLCGCNITGITNGVASLTLNNATDQVYEVLSKTDLTRTNWTIEPGEVWPTNSTVMPFTVSVLDRTKALFIRAADWTGVTENGNTVPDWWFWKYFGTVALSDTNLDTVGNTLLYDYQNGMDPLNANDPYNGRLPELEIISGNNQSGFPGFIPALAFNRTGDRFKFKHTGQCTDYVIGF